MIQGKFWKKFFIISLTIVWVVSSCRKPNKRLPEDYEVATAWADMTNYITKNTPANTPTFASRCFGYIGLTMYESVVNGSPEYQSVAAQLNGLSSLPLPEKRVTYNWPLVLNAKIALKKPADYQWIGKPIQRVDIPGKLTGEWKIGRASCRERVYSSV